MHLLRAQETKNEVSSNKNTNKNRFVVFKRRDPEGKFVINNVLMNGHAHMLEYLLLNWFDAHANLPLTLEGNTTLLHQALCKAAFVKP